MGRLALGSTRNDNTFWDLFKIFMLIQIGHDSKYIFPCSKN
jgi:hypothetical protein